MMNRAPVSFVAALLLIGLAGRAGAACPSVPCDCVGTAAADYRAVVVDRFFSNYNTVYGNVCADTAWLIEPHTDAVPADFEGSMHVLGGVQQLTVRARIPRADPGDSIVVAGVLATRAGAVVTGPISASAIDTTGTHPGVSNCQQAIADIGATSDMLALLAPTQVLPRIVADGPGTTQFPVGPGVQVIEVENRIAVREGILEIVLDPATDAAIFNTRALSLRRNTRIVVSGGDDTKVLINVRYPGPGVVVKSGAWVVPVVFAPDRVVRATGARFASIFAERLILRESLVDVIADTCPSPSGAFLEPAGTF